MPEKGYYWLDLSNINRRDHSPGTINAHAKYCARQSACDLIISVNLPQNRHALQRALRDYERHITATSRKDARLAYKVMVALPVQAPREAQVEATRRFIWSLSMQGRGRVAAFFHDLETANPHAHILFIDRDKDTGKSVAMLSAKAKERAAKGLEPNSTEWLRQLWELECNGVLAEQGLEVRIDRRSNLEQGLEKGRQRLAKEEYEKLQERQARLKLEAESIFAELRKGDVQEPPTPEEFGIETPEPIVMPEEVEREEAPALAQDEAIEAPEIVEDEPELHPHAPAEHLAAPDEEVEELAPPSAAEDPVAGTKYDGPERPNDQRVRDALWFARDHEFLRETRAEIQRLKDQKESLEREAKLASANYFAAMADRNAADQAYLEAVDAHARYTRNGEPRGFTVLGFRSPTRRRAERAIKAKGETDYALQKAEERLTKRSDEVEALRKAEERRAAREEEVTQKLQSKFELMGSEEEMARAEQMLGAGVHDSLEGITVDMLEEMHSRGQITDGEFRGALHCLGERAKAELFDELLEERDDKYDRSR
ncbi:MobA/MobL family protein [Methylopila sp. 73B]|uniref:MobA/MobL family protein n=1 Tax=Methylopila sp. 73B TaxID=1120792 RepID=UPI000382D5B2|nr:MobA/MobL family protein [Methylopila sp. 73B]